MVCEREPNIVTICMHNTSTVRGSHTKLKNIISINQSSNDDTVLDLPTKEAGKHTCCAVFGKVAYNLVSN